MELLGSLVSFWVYRFFGIGEKCSLKYSSAQLRREAFLYDYAQKNRALHDR